MRLFGIVLIVLILLAGGGYVYLATQDWKGRQQINAAGLRHLLVLQGLPLDGEDFAAEDETLFRTEMAGGESTTTVSKKLLESYFKDNAAPPTATTGAGTPGLEPVAAGPRVALATNEAVTNQLAEVRRVFALLKGELNKAATPAQKATLAVGWVLLQAETANERAELLALAAPTDGSGAAKTAEQLTADAAELAHRLDRKFYSVAPKMYDSADGALAPEKWQALAEKPPPVTDEAARRARLAHLLVHLDTDAVWQKRVGIVVGLRRYVAAVATQATRFREMREHTLLPLAADQAAFQKQQDLLLVEARQNVDKARAVAADKAKFAEQKTAADDAVSRRRTQLADLTAQLQKVRTEVDELLVQQTGIERQLYEIQREVGLTLEEVYRLDALLAEVERERYGLSPRP